MKKKFTIALSTLLFAMLLISLCLLLSSCEHTHTPAAAVTENLKEATCTAGGSYDEVVYCSDCGETISRTERITDKLGHDIIELPYKAPTCVDTGLTAGKECTRCDKKIIRQLILPTGEHTYDSIEDNECNLCGHIDNSGCAHISVRMIVVKAPTCTEDGLIGGKCTDCGRIVNKPEVVERLGHKVVILPSREPTCTEFGLTKGRKCERCAKILTYQLKLPEASHTYDSILDTECNICGHIRDKFERPNHFLIKLAEYKKPYKPAPKIPKIIILP